MSIIDPIDRQGVNSKVYDDLKEFEPQEQQIESQQEEAQVSGEADTQEQEPVEKNSAKERVREVVADKNVIKAENEVKDAQIRSLQSQLESNGYEGFPQYTPPQVKPGEEISPEQYQQHIASAADAMVDLKLRAYENRNRLKGEIIDAINENPSLNPKHDAFDKDLSEAVTNAVDAFLKASPTGNVKKYIDSLMKPYQKSIQREVGKQTENVAKQVSDAALRPTAPSSTGGKQFKDLSLEEMEKKLGKVYG